MCARVLFVCAKECDDDLFTDFPLITPWRIVTDHPGTPLMFSVLPVPYTRTVPLVFSYQLPQREGSFFLYFITRVHNLLKTDPRSALILERSDLQMGCKNYCVYFGLFNLTEPSLNVWVIIPCPSPNSQLLNEQHLCKWCNYFLLGTRDWHKFLNICFLSLDKNCFINLLHRLQSLSNVQGSTIQLLFASKEHKFCY